MYINLKSESNNNNNGEIMKAWQRRQNENNEISMK
jgi:hypothetical protein